MTEIIEKTDEISSLTLTEASEQLGMSVKALKMRCDRGTIDYIKDGRGYRRIISSEIDRLANGENYNSLHYDPYRYDPEFDIPKSELWGEGKAPVIKLPKKDWVTVMGVNDIHVPYHDEVLVTASIAIAKVIDPDIFILNGDINDFFAISRFNKANERLDILQYEIDMGIDVRRAYRAALPNAQFEETIGNHEERLITYPAFNAPALKSLSALKPSKLMGLDELEIRHWPMNGFRLKDDFLVEHGSVIRSQSGYTAKARLDATLISGVMGHTHRADSHSRTGFRELQWYETGCLCKLNPDYVRNEANWKQAFWVGTISTKTDNFNIQLIKATGRGFIFDGKHYGETSQEADIWSAAVPAMK